MPKTATKRNGKNVIKALVTKAEVSKSSRSGGNATRGKTSNPRNVIGDERLARLEQRGMGIETPGTATRTPTQKRKSADKLKKIVKKAVKTAVKAVKKRK